MKEAVWFTISHNLPKCTGTRIHTHTHTQNVQNTLAIFLTYSHPLTHPHSYLTRISYRYMYNMYTYLIVVFPHNVSHLLPLGGFDGRSFRSPKPFGILSIIFLCEVHQLGKLWICGLFNITFTHTHTHTHRTNEWTIVGTLDLAESSWPITGTEVHLTGQSQLGKGSRPPLILLTT